MQLLTHVEISTIHIRPLISRRQETGSPSSHIRVFAFGPVTRCRCGSRSRAPPEVRQAADGGQDFNVPPETCLQLRFDGDARAACSFIGGCDDCATLPVDEGAAASLTPPLSASPCRWCWTPCGRCGALEPASTTTSTPAPWRRGSTSWRTSSPSTSL